MRSDLQANNMKPEFLDKTITQTLSTGSMLRWLQSGKETCLPVISCCAASCTRTLAWTQMKSCHSLRFHGEAAQQRERCAQKMPGKCSEASPISPEPPGQLCLMPIIVARRLPSSLAFVARRRCLGCLATSPSEASARNEPSSARWQPPAATAG